MSARGEKTRAAILDAAVARIVALGFEGLRVRDVAGDVGINNATLHHHYPTKTALVEAIVLRFVAAFKTDARVPADGSIEQRLAAYVAIRREQMHADPAAGAVLCELLVLARRDEEVRRLMIETQRSWRAYLVSVCREANLPLDEARLRADRCRREIIGAALDGGLGLPDAD